MLPFKHPVNVSLTYHYAGVELVEALHGAVAETVAQVLLDKIGMVEDVVSHQRLLPPKREGKKRVESDIIPD